MRRELYLSLVCVVPFVGGCSVDLPDTHPTSSAPTISVPIPSIIIQQVPTSAPVTSATPPPPGPTQVPTIPPGLLSGVPVAPTSPPALPTTPPTTNAPSASNGGCSLPKGPGDGTNCPRLGSAIHLDAVDAALTRVGRNRPDLVSGDRVSGGNTNAFYNAVVNELRAAGYCAIFDGEEIAVKDTNSYSEQYHVLTSAGIVRRGDGSYRATCSPAWF
jgi:hypothetical protein